jgi:Uncharacterized copper-binding protein
MNRPNFQVPLAVLVALTLAAPLTPLLAHGSSHEKAQMGERKATPAEQKSWGIAGEPAKVTRIVAVEMSDTMRFSPNSLQVKEGETIRFQVKNAGKVLHEMVIGTREELDSHAAMMKKYPNMEHDEAYMAHVDPQKTGDIVWLFNRKGSFEFACLVAGHYDAGMRGTILVGQ